MTFLRWGCSFLNWDILTFNRWNGVKDEKYYGGSLKNPIFGGGILKNKYIGEDCLKSGDWTVYRFKGGLDKKRGCCF